MVLYNWAKRFRYKEESISGDHPIFQRSLNAVKGWFLLAASDSSHERERERERAGGPLSLHVRWPPDNHSAIEVCHSSQKSRAVILCGPFVVNRVGRSSEASRVFEAHCRDLISNSLLPFLERDHICDLYGDYYCPNARCVPVQTSYRCECNPGYEMTSVGRCKKSFGRVSAGSDVSKRRDSRKKKQRDYCTTYPYLCSNGKCISTSNYFYCDCNPGYKAVDEKRRCRKGEITQRCRVFN